MQLSKGRRTRHETRKSDRRLAGYQVLDPRVLHHREGGPDVLNRLDEVVARRHQHRGHLIEAVLRRYLSPALAGVRVLVEIEKKDVDRHSSSFVFFASHDDAPFPSLFARLIADE